MIITPSEIENIDKNIKTVLAGGCFDIIHPGHIEFLNTAKSISEKLIILLESDENVKERKGNDRPIHSQKVRSKNLEKLGIVDYIVCLPYINTNEYYYNLVLSLHPDIIAVTKGDPLLDIKREQAKLVNGEVIEVIPRREEHSSTNLINKTK